MSICSSNFSTTVSSLSVALSPFKVSLACIILPCRAAFLSRSLPRPKPTPLDKSLPAPAAAAAARGLPVAPKASPAERPAGTFPFAKLSALPAWLKSFCCPGLLISWRIFSRTNASRPEFCAASARRSFAIFCSCTSSSSVFAFFSSLSVTFLRTLTDSLDTNLPVSARGTCSPARPRSSAADWPTLIAAIILFQC